MRKETEMGQFDNIPTELAEKAKGCKTPEELLALAKEEGYELSDEQLQYVSGGWIGECNNHCHADCWRDGIPNS